jgi:DNA gyrase inhibitor GyrI
MAAWQRQSQLADVRAVAQVMGVAFDDPDPCMSRCTRCLPTRMP